MPAISSAQINFFQHLRGPRFFLPSIHPSIIRNQLETPRRPSMMMIPAHEPRFYFLDIALLCHTHSPQPGKERQSAKQGPVMRAGRGCLLLAGFPGAR